MGSEKPMGSESGKGAGDSAQPSASDFAAVQKELSSLKSANRELERRLQAQDDVTLSQDYLDFLAAKERGREDEKSEASEEEPDFDRMGGKQLVEHVTKKTLGELKKAREEVAEELRVLKIEHAKATITQDLELCKIRHPDLEQKWADKGYLDAFYVKAKENPSWRAERVYKEVERDLRDAGEAKEAEDRKRARTELDAATERGGVPSSTTRPRALSKDEAVQLAYRKVHGTEKE